jgi:hypothetical protein
MIFRDLLDIIGKTDIQMYFQEIESEVPYIDKYIELFENLRNHVVEENDLELLVVKQKDYFEGQISLEVFGYSYIDKEHYALDFMERSRWLGSSVNQKSLDTFGVTCFVCECLYEMSFISFDEGKIEEERNILDERVREIESGEVNYLSSEEVFANLREKFDMGELSVHEVEIDENSEEYKLRHQKTQEIYAYNMNEIKKMVG